MHITIISDIHAYYSLYSLLMLCIMMTVISRYSCILLTLFTTDGVAEDEEEPNPWYLEVVILVFPMPGRVVEFFVSSVPSKTNNYYNYILFSLTECPYYVFGQHIVWMTVRNSLIFISD